MLNICSTGERGALPASQRRSDWNHKNVANWANRHNSDALARQWNAGCYFKQSKNLNLPFFFKRMIIRETWTLFRKFWSGYCNHFSGANLHDESKSVGWDFENPGCRQWEVCGSCFFPHSDEHLCGNCCCSKTHNVLCLFGVFQLCFYWL